MAEHNELGARGEALAVEELSRKNYAILERNYRFRHLELDIVAEKDGMLVIVEVKTRQSDYLTDPSEILSKSKQKLLIRAANHYIEEKEIDLECRFDLMIIVLNSKQIKVEHIEDAFYPTV